MTKKEIGKLVKAVRKEKKITTYQLMHQARVMPQQIAAIEAASKNYTIDCLLKTLTHCGIQLHATVLQK